MKNTENSFLRYISKHENGCWIYTGEILKNGYGRFHYGGKRHLAHRFSFRFFNGYIKENYLVCHSCDNRKCVNPLHLWLGSYRDNNIDTIKKGRRPKRRASLVCRAGHELNQSNRFISANGKSNGCIICRKQKRRERYLKLGV